MAVGSRTFGQTDPAQGAFTITPSDSVDLTRHARAIYVGAAGDIKLRTFSSEDVIFVAVPQGSILPVMATRVFATLTTASSLVALY